MDLIVWPETSLPGVITDAPFLADEIQATAADLHTPMLIGSIAKDGEKYYNSAFLIGADGQMLGRYDKIHLVPFGEYLPLRPVLGWINKIVPLDDFTSGRRIKIFSIHPSQKKFGVLICFEDTLGYLRRNFVHAGAGFFVNMTNDAWFTDTKAPFLHLQAAVFGCVENHRSLARAANTGVSALVDPWGRIISHRCRRAWQRNFYRRDRLGRAAFKSRKVFLYKVWRYFYYFMFFVYINGSSTLEKIVPIREFLCLKRFYWLMMIQGSMWSLFRF